MPLFNNTWPMGPSAHLKTFLTLELVGGYIPEKKTPVHHYMDFFHICVYKQ